MIYIFLSL